MRSAEALVRQVIKDHLDKQGFTLDATFGDELGVDSLELVQMLMALEETPELGNRVMDVYKLDEVTTVGDFVDLVKTYLPQEQEHAKEASD